MALLLLKSTDNNNADPEKDKMCYKRGDVVEVRDDASGFGNAECLDKFLVVKVEGSQEDFIYLQGAKTETVNGEETAVLKRKYKVDIDTSVPNLAEIEASDWLVPTIDITQIIEK